MGPAPGRPHPLGSVAGEGHGDPVTAPLHEDFPGATTRPALIKEPDTWADDVADVIAVIGWYGAVNWEERFGARVVGLGFDTMMLSVAAPPQSHEDALRVAAEHLAFCPDTIEQGVGSVDAYAREIRGVPHWSFWWD